MALFCAKFACILAIRNPVFRWESCKDSMCEKVWRIAQVCAKKQGLAARSHGWLATASHQIEAHVPSMPEAEACQLGRNQFHIGWCYGQVAESGKLEKK